MSGKTEIDASCVFIEKAVLFDIYNYIARVILLCVRPAPV